MFSKLNALFNKNGLTISFMILTFLISKNNIQEKLIYFVFLDCPDNKYFIAAATSVIRIKKSHHFLHFQKKLATGVYVSCSIRKLCCSQQYFYVAIISFCCNFRCLHKDNYLENTQKAECLSSKIDENF